VNQANHTAATNAIRIALLGWGRSGKYVSREVFLFRDRARGWRSIGQPIGDKIAELYEAAADEREAGLDPCR